MLASVVYVGNQIRQDTQAVRSATAQAVHDNYAAWYQGYANDPVLMKIAVDGLRDYGSLNEVEKAQFIIVAGFEGPGRSACTPRPAVGILVGRHEPTLVGLNRRRSRNPMNWEALGATGEIVGAAGVIFSLLYLASQVRDNSRQLRHASAQAVLDKLNGLIGHLAFTAGAGDVWSRGLSGLDSLRSDEEIVRFSSMMLQAFWAYEEVLHYRNAGLVEDWAWAHAKAPVEHFMRTPGFQEWWALRREWFSPEFRTHVEASMPTTTGALVEDFRRRADAIDQTVGSGTSEPRPGPVQSRI